MPKRVTCQHVAKNQHLRVSDQERDAVAAEIREHYAAGRLTSGEFEERLQTTLSASTRGELAAVSTDLPALPPKPPSTWEVALQTGREAGGWLGITALVVAGWALTGASLVVLVFMLLFIARRIQCGGRRRARRDAGFNDGWWRGGYRGYGRGPGRHRWPQG